MITLKETRGDMVKVKSSVNRRVWGMMLNEILKKCLIVPELSM